MTDNCPKCGFKDVALVKREPLAGGEYRRYLRCPRCDHTWDKKD
ncbi:MAG: hypothetical protein RTU92_02865 [Candidatus Thorarchaeota archaeon]